MERYNSIYKEEKQEMMSEDGVSLVDKIKGGIARLAHSFGVSPMWQDDTAEYAFKLLQMSKTTNARLPLKLREVIEKFYQNSIGV